MLHSPPHLLLSSSSTASCTLFLPHSPFLRNSITTTFKHHSLTPQLSTRSLAPLLAQIPDDGPVELPFSFPSFISTDDDPSSLQVATSLLLTGAISIFLFRSLRRRAKRAKELRFRSTGAKKTLKEEAIESLKAMSPVEENAPPSPFQALLGGLTAGVIALILYKFATTVEASLNRQTISDNYSVRQITITIRTIINGLCYLATFVFGINSIGLMLYSGQLGFNSLMGDSSSDQIQNKDEAQLTSSNPTSSDDPETNGNEGDQSSNSTQ